jgi:signal transduction histidine kinase
VGTINYNLAVDCYILKRIEEGIAYCEKSIPILSGNPAFVYVLAGPYTKYRELLTVQGKFEKANQIADSVMKFNSLNFVRENDKKMLELEGQYEFERKQTQIADLNQQNQRKQALLAAAALMFCLLGVLGYQLYQANQRLKAFAKVREHFFGIIAHDMRRPMHAFHGMSQLVNFYLKRGNYQAIHELSYAIDESSIKIQKMLDNLLSWALSQRDGLPYNPVTTLVEPPIRSVVELYEKVNLLKEVTFEVNCPANSAAFVDPNALELIIRNLIDNSYKALEVKGHVTITVSVLSTGQTHITLQDNGQGIPPEKQQIIQDTFNHPDKAQIGQKGMGMGLIMVARFTQRNRGKITVESTQGAGTTFSLILPQK